MRRPIGGFVLTAVLLASAPAMSAPTASAIVSFRKVPGLAMIGCFGASNGEPDRCVAAFHTKGGIRILYAQTSRQQPIALIRDITLRNAALFLIPGPGSIPGIQLDAVVKGVGPIHLTSFGERLIDGYQQVCALCSFIFYQLNPPKGSLLAGFATASGTMGSASVSGSAFAYTLNPGGSGDVIIIGV